MNQEKPKSRAVVKQILSGDSVVIRGLSGTPPPEKQIAFSSVTAPKLGKKIGQNPETKDEPWAWEAREFLRKKLIGKEILFTSEKPANTNREYGTLYLGDENITESLISEGLVTVRESRSPDSAHLLELQNAAKAAGKGIWGKDSPQDHVRDIKWSLDVSQMRPFVEKHQYKPIKAVVEHVRDGSTIRAFLLPDFHYITLMISGIRCPRYELDRSGKPDPSVKVPFADYARYFVEVRLLQREVEIVLESVNNNNFVGSIQHPNGNIAELLLENGLAQCVDWSLSFMKSGVESLKAAEKKAKDQKLNIWTVITPSVPKVTGKEKEFSATVIEILNGDALNIKLANGDVKKIFLSSIRAPREKEGGVRDDEGKPAPRPKGFRPLYDIPYMFEAREFLRKKLIGKKVNVIIDYIQEAKDSFPEKVCATVLVGGKNVAEALVAKGLATVLKYRQDDDQRSSRYDALLAASDKAEKTQVGIYNKKDAAPMRIAEMDINRAKLELSSMQRAQRLDGIVEFVASGSRVRLFIPKSNILCTLLLGGVVCPRAARQAMGNQAPTEAEPFGNEALQFTKELCLQRDVSIQVDNFDKVGNFIGWLWIDNLNLSVALVEAGLAYARDGEKSQYSGLVKQAEEQAKKKRLNIWKNYVEEQEKEVVREEIQDDDKTIHYTEVVVTEVTPEGTFFVQTISEGADAESLYNKLRQEFRANEPLPGAFTPKRGEICAAKFTADDEWYRVKVEKVQGSNAAVLYIDYGNRETLPTSRLASLSPTYKTKSPFAVEYAMPYVQLPKDEEYATHAIQYFKEDVAVPKLYLNILFRGSPGAATLCTEKNPDTDIIKNLIREGLLLVEPRKGKISKIMASYLEAQEKAKKEHLNIWEYGDITETDAKEFGLGN